MKEYVLGFALHGNVEQPDDLSVLLYRKETGSMHAGQLNGVGGKVEEGESFLAAMQREYQEETGYEHVPTWRRVVQLAFEDAVVHVYVTVQTTRRVGNRYGNPPNDRARWVPWRPHPPAGDYLAPHVKWLVDLCIEFYVRGIVDAKMQIPTGS